MGSLALPLFKVLKNISPSFSGGTDAHDRPLRAHPGVYSSPPSSLGAAGNAVQLATTGGRSLTVDRRNLRHRPFLLPLGLFQGPNAAIFVAPAATTCCATAVCSDLCTQSRAFWAPVPAVLEHPTRAAVLQPNRFWQLCFKSVQGREGNRGTEAVISLLFLQKLFTTVGEADSHGYAAWKSSSRAWTQSSAPSWSS